MKTRSAPASGWRLVIPIVLLIIFVLLYRTYGSAKEAAHVLLAVPFALSGGVFLVKLLGLNFSVAVWVGFIALFGTAVQTGVVMVIYLEEAVARRISPRWPPHARGLARSRDGGRSAAPASQGDDRGHGGRRPAAADVVHPHRRGVHETARRPGLGGMLSSLLHVLIVTPVIFIWLREREMRKRAEVAQIA